MIIDFIDENDTIETCENKIKELQKEVVSGTDSSLLSIEYKIECLRMHIEYLKGNYTDMTNQEL